MSTNQEFPALVVRQWMSEWDDVGYDPSEHQARPLKDFLLLSMPARVLRRLSNTYRRDAEFGISRSQDKGIQRKHDELRSAEISRFVRDGYPLSALTATKRRSATDSLRKPGWLPTAIVVNILDPANPIAGRNIHGKDAIRVPPPSEWERGRTVSLGLPESWKSAAWEPELDYPIEIIDGQHRLWSFHDDDEGDFDLPVVAFFGLDVSWQAYLFWTINIKPKKINASLAYDLYPLLRDQDWLIEGEGIDVYRETRSQELTEALWSHPSSPWVDRINMLGETGVKRERPVTQAAFVRSISESLVRPWEGRTSRTGGLFGGSRNGRGLDWTRAQQASFLIYAWAQLCNAVEASTAEWAQSVRQGESANSMRPDPAFAGPYTLLASDQGIRAFHQLINDVCFVGAERFSLAQWRASTPEEDVSAEAVSAELASLASSEIHALLQGVAVPLAEFDWRNAKSPELSPEELRDKQALRGSGGYKILRESLLEHLIGTASDQISSLALEAHQARQ